MLYAQAQRPARQKCVLAHFARSKPDSFHLPFHYFLEKNLPLSANQMRLVFAYGTFPVLYFHFATVINNGSFLALPVSGMLFVAFLMVMKHECITMNNVSEKRKYPG